MASVKGRFAIMLRILKFFFFWYCICILLVYVVHYFLGIRIYRLGSPYGRKT